MLRNLWMKYMDFVRSHSYAFIRKLNLVLFFFFAFLPFIIFPLTIIKESKFTFYYYVICLIVSIILNELNLNLHPDNNLVNLREGQENFYKYLPEVSKGERYIIVEGYVGKQLEKLLKEEKYEIYSKGNSKTVYKKLSEV